MIETREQFFEYFTKHNYDFLPGKDPSTFKPFSGARILDIGANLGMVTAFWSMNGADVTSYEADPETYKIMTDMFARIDIKAKVINKAIWIYDGLVSFRGVEIRDGERVCRNGQIEQNSESVSVPCTTLAAALGDTVWDCVKIDIEGAEYEVLMNTNLDAMKNIRYMNLELHEEKYYSSWMTPSQREELRGKLSKIFEIKSSVYSDGFWHLFKKEDM